MAYNITRTKRGYYCVRVQVGGVRRTAYAKTEAEARERLKKLQIEVAIDGGFADPRGCTLADLVAAWLSSANVRASTYVYYERAMRLYVLPVLGSLRLDKLTPQRIEAVLRELGPPKAHKACLALHRCLNVAKRWGWLSSNPCGPCAATGAQAKAPDHVERRATARVRRSGGGELPAAIATRDDRRAPRREASAALARRRARRRGDHHRAFGAMAERSRLEVHAAEE